MCIETLNLWIAYLYIEVYNLATALINSPVKVEKGDWLLETLYLWIAHLYIEVDILATALINSPVQVEREDRILDEFLLYHLVEDRGDAIDGDGVISHTQDTIKLRSHKHNTGLRHGLSKCLALNSEAANLKAKNKHRK